MDTIRSLWNTFGPQAIKFCTVGAVGVVIQTASLYALVEYGRVWYVAANAVAAVLAQLFAFSGYKYWAFASKTQRQQYTFGFQFVVHWLVWGCGLAIATGVIFICTDYLHVWYVISSWVATAISGLSNFLSHKFFTYRPEGAGSKAVT